MSVVHWGILISSSLTFAHNAPPPPPPPTSAFTQQVQTGPEFAMPMRAVKFLRGGKKDHEGGGGGGYR
jgi:hypothetical protein